MVVERELRSMEHTIDDTAPGTMFSDHMGEAWGTWYSHRYTTTYDTKYEILYVTYYT